MRADPRLIEAARGGDAVALADLLGACHPDLRRFARRTCATTEDAEDAVQIALWQLYRRIGALRTVATFAAWLFRIVERECFRLFRRGDRAEALELLPEALQPEAAAIPVDLRLDLARAIRRLSPAYRDVLVLRDIHELTAPEVAAQLGLSLQAVKSRLHRARAMVREQLLASGYWLDAGELQPAPAAPIAAERG
jgi:RNA polymerase sigma factor (sigma-70 family)